MRTRVAVVGSGNIGSDLLVTLQRSTVLEPVLLVEVDPASDGVRRTRELGVEATAGGVDDLLRDPRGVEIVFEATSAQAHLANAARYAQGGLTALDPTPATVGPFVVPAVNLHARRAAARYAVPDSELVLELGRRGFVGGQEDLIVDVALELAGQSHP